MDPKPYGTDDEYSEIDMGDADYFLSDGEDIIAFLNEALKTEGMAKFITAFRTEVKLKNQPRIPNKSADRQNIISELITSHGTYGAKEAAEELSSNLSKYVKKDFRVRFLLFINQIDASELRFRTPEKYGGHIPENLEDLTPGSSRQRGLNPGYNTRLTLDPQEGDVMGALDDEDKVMGEIGSGTPMPSSPSQLCPACISGLCDTHIQLRF